MTATVSSVLSATVIETEKDRGAQPLKRGAVDTLDPPVRRPGQSGLTGTR